LIKRLASVLALRRNNAMDTMNTSTKILASVSVVPDSNVKELRDLMKTHAHVNVQEYPLAHQINT